MVIFFELHLNLSFRPFGLGSGFDHFGRSAVELHRAAQEVHETVLTNAPHIETMGNYRATVHTFDDAFVVQFRESSEQGVAISFDRDIGRNLHEFMPECEAYLG
ncbi:hypothetical protein GCM10009066_02780 [Halarchaeum salinum]|uniref:Uncharacterized protein n=1 Tax=Halarchaeum salinum TaxID=489912 RepID=A0AAV3S2F5_9EURY